jgi:hypothetical protein
LSKVLGLLAGTEPGDSKMLLTMWFFFDKICSNY